MGSRDHSFNFTNLTTKLKSQLKNKNAVFIRGESNVYKLSGDTFQKIPYEKHNTMHNYSIVELCDDVFISCEITFKLIIEDQIETASSFSKKDRKKYICDNFLIENDYIFGTLISVSFFHHDRDSDSYTRIIRAEWDTQNGQDSHPQPHWHFCLNDINKQNYQNLTSSLSGSDFSDYLNEKKKSIVNIENFHFAMAVKSDDNWNHQSRLTSRDKITDWAIWLLRHTKDQFAHIGW